MQQVHAKGYVVYCLTSCDTNDLVQLGRVYFLDKVFIRIAWLIWTGSLSSHLIRSVYLSLFSLLIQLGARLLSSLFLLRRPQFGNAVLRSCVSRIPEDAKERKGGLAALRFIHIDVMVASYMDSGMSQPHCEF